MKTQCSFYLRTEKLQRTFKIFEFFFLALLDTSQDVGSMFDRLTTTQYGIKFNLTIGMYWVCPDVYFPLDGPSRRFLQEHGIEVGHKVPSFAEYKTIIEEVKSKVCEKPF